VRSQPIGFTYRLLLHLYPRGFRETYGRDLVWRLAEMRKACPPSTFGSRLRAHWDLARNAVGVRVDSARSTLF